jgi:hypothetical protein
MTHIDRGIRFVAGVAALAALTPLVASAQKAAGNILEIVVGSGPYAGTYKAPTDQVICLYVKTRPQFSVSYKNFSPNGATALAEGGINVDNPDDAGAKRGHVLTTFGSSDKKPPFYDVSVPGPGAGPITLKRSGTRAELTYQGKTKDGVQVRVTATCSDIDQM